MADRTEGQEHRVVIVVPTYNEAENVRPLAERVLAADSSLDLLIVDDASPDGTGEICDEIAATEPRFHVLHRTGPRGYAPASQEGLRWALDQGYRAVGTMDGDLSHDPARIPAMLDRLAAGAGLVIGSRYVEGGGLEVEWGPIRRAVSQMGSAYARAMIGTRVCDCTSGFRLYSTAALGGLRFERLRSEGYAFLIEVLAELTAAGVRIDEVPITYIDRKAGASKISRRIVFEALGETTGLGLRRVFGRSSRGSYSAK
jgi:dolichol-phosphate mannosyltransferase